MHYQILRNYQKIVVYLKVYYINLRQMLIIQFVLSVKIFDGNLLLVDKINVSNHIVKFVQIIGFKIKLEMQYYKNRCIPNLKLLFLILDLDHSNVLNLLLFVKWLNKYKLQLLNLIAQNVKDLLKEHLYLLYIIYQIQLSCIYEECTTKSKYEQFQMHILQCQFRRINCSGYGIQQLQYQLEQHENKCEQITIKCSKCYNVISRDQYSSHSIDDCIQQQFKNKDNQIIQLQKKLDEFNQKNQQLEQQLCTILKGKSFDTIHQFSIKTIFTQNYQFNGIQRVEVKLIYPSFNGQKQKNDFLHFYINHKIKTQAIQGIIWKMKIQTLKGNLLIGICSSLCQYSLDFIINKQGEIKRKEWNENKYKQLRKTYFTFNEGDTFTFQFIPFQQCLKITNENRHIICKFDQTEILEMGDSLFSFFSLENEGDSLIFI